MPHPIPSCCFPAGYFPYDRARALTNFPEADFGPKPPAPGPAEEELTHAEAQHGHGGSGLSGCPPSVAWDPSGPPQGQEWRLPPIPAACGQGRLCGAAGTGQVRPQGGGVRGWGWVLGEDGGSGPPQWLRAMSQGSSSSGQSRSLNVEHQSCPDVFRSSKHGSPPRGRCDGHPVHLGFPVIPLRITGIRLQLSGTVLCSHFCWSRHSCRAGSQGCANP